MNLRKISALVRGNPAVALGVAAFAGFALGSGALPFSLPTFSLPIKTATKAAAAPAASEQPVATPVSDLWA